MNAYIPLFLFVLAAMGCVETGAADGQPAGITGTLISTPAAHRSRPIEMPSVRPKNKVSTANPNATADARRVLSYLRSLRPGKDKSVLVGQNMGHIEYRFDSNVEAYYAGLQRMTGALPAIFAVDYGYENPSRTNILRANELLAAHCMMGGIVSISIHPKNPFTGGDVGDRSTGGKPFSDILTPGTSTRQNWLETLDAVALGLADLRDRGVTVLWRPLHEMNGDWFWWSVDRGGDFVARQSFQALWRDMFEYFTEEKGLNNLLWVYSANAVLNMQSQDTDAYFPGNDLVDIVGLDYYYNDFSMLNNRGGYDRLVALGKPLALTEVGPANWARAHPKGRYDLMQVIKAIRTDYREIRYFTFWNGWRNGFRRSYSALTENQNTQGLIDSPEIVTLGEMRELAGQPSCNKNP